MAKININSCIHNLDDKNTYKNNCIGTLENSNICYQDGEVSVTICILDNKINMIRTTNDYSLNLNFDSSIKTSGIYKINDVGKINLDITTNRLDIIDKRIYIEYILKNDSVLLGNFKFDLEYEVI